MVAVLQNRAHLPRILDSRGRVSQRLWHCNRNASACQYIDEIFSVLWPLDRFFKSRYNKLSGIRKNRNMKISPKNSMSVRKGHHHQRPKTWASKDRDPIRDRRDWKRERANYAQ